MPSDFLLAVPDVPWNSRPASFTSSDSAARTTNPRCHPVDTLRMQHDRWAETNLSKTAHWRELGLRALVWKICESSTPLSGSTSRL